MEGDYTVGNPDGKMTVAGRRVRLINEIGKNENDGDGGCNLRGDESST